MNEFLELPRAVSIQKYFNAFPHLIITPETTICTIDCFYFSKKKAHGLRNIRITGITTNIEEITLNFFRESIKFKNMKNEQSWNVPYFTCLCILRTMCFFSPVLKFKRKKGTIDPITISFEHVTCGGRRDFIEDSLLLEPMYMRANNSLLKFCDGQIGFVLPKSPLKLPHWVETLEEMKPSELKRFNMPENKIELIDWSCWSRHQAVIKKILKKGNKIKSCIIVYSEMYSKVIVSFASNNTKKTIKDILDSPKLHGLFTSVEKKNNLFGNGEKRDYLRYVCKKPLVQELETNIHKLWPDAHVSIEKIMDENKTEKTRLWHLLAMDKKCKVYFRAMDNPYPPQEHYVTDLDTAFLNSLIADYFPNDFKIDTIENIRNSRKGQLVLKKCIEKEKEKKLKLRNLYVCYN